MSEIRERDGALRQMRPELPISEPTAVTSVAEKFQNETIRPVVVFQHTILMAQMRHYLRLFKPAFNAYNQRVQRAYLHDVLKADSRIRNSLIASVVSLFTLPEYETYCTLKSEANKRIISILTQRFQDNLEQLY